MKIKQAKGKDDFLKCWDVVHELRPHLDQEQYLTLILHMIDEGNKMIYIEEEGKAVSFCGYRLTTMLHRGRSIYIDDLCTLPETRGKGHAKTLLNYVLKEAKKEQLQSVHLDSGHHRYDARRLYLNFGFRISSHHFAMELNSAFEFPDVEVSDPSLNSR